MKYSASDVTNVFSNQHGRPVAGSELSFRVIAISSKPVTVQDARTSQKTEKKWNPGSGQSGRDEGRREEQQASAEAD